MFMGERLRDYVLDIVFHQLDFLKKIEFLSFSLHKIQRNTRIRIVYMIYLETATIYACTWESKGIDVEAWIY